MRACVDPPCPCRAAARAASAIARREALEEAARLVEGFEFGDDVEWGSEDAILAAAIRALMEKE